MYADIYMCACMRVCKHVAVYECISACLCSDPCLCSQTMEISQALTKEYVERVGKPKRECVYACMRV
jgi:hypothetical protein